MSSDRQQVQDRYKVGQQISIIAVLTNTCLGVIKLLAGIFANSTAMLADALHTFSDVITSLGVIFSFMISKKPPDKEHPYGHGRAESICAKLIAVALIGTSILMIYNSSHTILMGKLIAPKVPAVWAAILSILSQEFLFQISYRTGKRIRSNALMADAWHHRSDALSSVAALIGIVLARRGFLLFDPLAGIVVSVMVGSVGIKIFRESINELMDSQNNPEFSLSLTTQAKEVDDVFEVSDVRIRHYGPQVFVDMTISVDSGLTVAKGHAIAEKVRTNLQRANTEIKNILVHVNPK